MVDGYAPDRGDVVWLSFSPHAGHEQAGRRPALIISPRAYNQRVGLAICCPITSQAKGYPFEVSLGMEGRTRGVVLSDQVKSLDWQARRAEFIERAPAAVTGEVLGKLGTLVSL